MKKAQREDEKNSVFCLVMFTPGVMVIPLTCQKWLIFCIFCKLQYYFADSVVVLYFYPQKPA